MRRSPILALCLLAGCQTPLPADDAGGRDVPLATDVPAGSDAPVTPQPERLSYTPEGCMHTVHTTANVRDIVRGNRNTFGARPEPAGVHVSWPADPARTIAFVWTTDAATQASVVQYGTSMTTLDREVVGHVSTGGTSTLAVTAHEAHVCGLTPDTTYYYRVGGEGHWSATQSFKTAPMPGAATADVNFVVAGDSRNGYGVLRMIEERAMSVSAMRSPDFELFSGDEVFLGTIQPEWVQWFAAASPVLSRMPIMLAHGNHDGLAINYLMQFAHPQTEDPQQDELYYSVDYGPVHIAVLNDSPYMGDLAGGLAGNQVSWLRADLTRARMNRAMVPWIVVVHHKPPFSSSTHSDEADTVFIRNTLPPIFDEFGVDVVFNGHDHQFEISQELDAMGRPVSGRRGTYYVTSAGAGAELYPTGNRAWRRYSESVANFALVHVTPRAFELTPHRLDGSVIREGQLTLAPRM